MGASYKWLVKLLEPYAKGGSVHIVKRAKKGKWRLIYVYVWFSAKNMPDFSIQ